MRRALVRAKDGDLSALHFLYVRYVDDVAERVQDVRGDLGALDEVMQEVLAGLVETLGEHQTHEIEALIMHAAAAAAADSNEAVEPPRRAAAERR